LEDLKQIDQNDAYTSYLASYESQGLKINGLLTVPTGDTPSGGWPAIVFVHGYIPPKEYQTTARYVDYVDYLARNNFVVFKIDLRGNGDSEGTPAGAYYSSGYVIDTLNAYAALQAAKPVSSASAQMKSTPSPSLTPDKTATPSVVVNPNKVGLWGHSMAGNIVMRAWAVKPTIPAVDIWAGAGYTYTDLTKYKIHDASYQPTASSSGRPNGNSQLRKLYGSPDLNNSFWKQVAPTTYLGDLKGAIQINQAVDDDVVNIGYNRDLIKLFDKTSIPHQMNEYPSGGHNISGPSFDTAMQNTVDFYKKYLK
jgi:fermentation-respiration switch protein FrsA (DUF1100 family)